MVLNLYSIARRKALDILAKIADLGKLSNTVLKKIESEYLANGGSKLQLKLLKKSLENKQKAIEKRQEEGQSFKRYTEKTVKSTIIESARRDLIENIDENEFRFGMLLSTISAKPDLEHALLEGVVLPIKKLKQEVSRFGCKHSIVVFETKKDAENYRK